MPRLTILSPHRDDAAFSLFVCLANWSLSSSVELRILNFFTESAYAPYALGGNAISVSAIRKREDLRALSSISRSIKITDRDLLDAPLRLEIPPSLVCKAKTRTLISEELLEQLKTAFSKIHRDLAIAPLGLGDHVDHIAVRRAAVRAIVPAHLAFYEDLPYATWTPEDILREHVLEVEEASRTKLKPVIVRDRRLVRLKRRIVAQYRSQISLGDASAIANWSKRYRSGERIWIPSRSAQWLALY